MPDWVQFLRFVSKKCGNNAEMNGEIFSNWMKFGSKVGFSDFFEIEASNFSDKIFWDHCFNWLRTNFIF